MLDPVTIRRIIIEEEERRQREQAPQPQLELPLYPARPPPGWRPPEPEVEERLPGSTVIELDM